MTCKETQRFGENANNSYKEAGLSGHTGVDYSCGYQTDVRAEWPVEYVYKVFTPSRPASDGFTGIFTIVEHDGELFEFLYGHVGGIKVKEGQTIHRGEIIATEGNYGRVWANGRPCDGASKLKGCGSHRHYQKRPLEKVRAVTPTMRCLTHPKTGLFRDEDGNWYNAPLYNNGFHGCVDFKLPSQEIKEIAETIDDITEAIEKPETPPEVDKTLWGIIKEWLKRLVELS